MSTTVTYKGSTLTTVDNQTRTLETAGKYLEDDITLVDVSGGGGASVASGTYTPVSDTTTAVIDIGDASLNNFLLYILGTATGNNKRVGALIRADFSAPNSLLVTSNSTGTSYTTCGLWLTSVNGLTKSGATITISGTGASAFNYFIGGISYQWFAW